MVASLPTTPGPVSETIRWESLTTVYVSPLSGAQQITSRPGGVWVIEMQLPPMNAWQSGQWAGRVFSYDGAATSVYVGPYHPGPRDRYDATADPVRTLHSCTIAYDFLNQDYRLRYITAPDVRIKGGSQTGTAPETDGWGARDGLNAGDWISFENGTFRELHVVTADSFANASGAMTISIHPPIRRSPADNAAVTIENPKGEFVLASSDGAAESLASNGSRGVNLTWREFIR